MDPASTRALTVGSAIPRRSLAKLFGCLLLACAGFLSTGRTRTVLAVDFSEVRPILSEKCFPCHGPDDATREADLRLDAREGLFAEREGLRIVVPGEPQASELFRRITAESARKRMPPRRAKLVLEDSEIEAIRHWIESGAEWERHWAFVPPARSPVPEVRDTSWPRDPIDRFVLARLEREGLRPAPEASRECWLRRVTLDLTGLPPTPAAVDAFLSDGSPQAYEKVADRLLASPAFGEHAAVDWLDTARFADTYGYQADRYNHLWPWRDWVIRAFNEGLPYDDFIVWQNAGDLLPRATREQRLATAFHRSHRQTNEGGSIDEEFRVEYNADRLRTSALAFLGLTLECARCHDHKYDPVSQEDYYRLFAFFNSTDESGLYSHFTDAIPSPTLLLYRSEAEETKHARLRAAIDRKKTELGRARCENRPRAATGTLLRTGSAGSGTSSGWLRGLRGSYSFDSIDGNRTANAADPGAPGTLHDAPASVPGKLGRALAFDGENSVTFEGMGEFARTQPFSFSLWLEIPDEREQVVILHRSKAGSDAGSRGYELLIENGRASFALIHFWPGNAVKVATLDKLPLGVWTHLAVTYDGSSRARGIRIYIDGRPAAVETIRDHLFKDILYSEKVPLTLAARFRGPGFRRGKVDTLEVFDRELTRLEVAGLYHRQSFEEMLEHPLAAEREAALEYYLANMDSGTQELLGELERLRKEESELIEAVPEVMTLGDLAEPRPTYILRRGAYNARGDVVEPGTPASILALDGSLPRNRLGFARWLVDRENPLTARVAVNRYWQILFGRGIVATPEDFGSQGARPSHPELLDWLAVWFRESGWDLKSLLRKVVLSATYRQSSVVPSALRDSDPENVLLARGSSRRLTAEMLRDQALAAAGVLDRSMGGPSARWPEKIEPGVRHRRTVYMYIQRTATAPYLLAFDATSREASIARRQTTNTPLQALVLLNEPLFTTAARAIAERAVQEGTSDLSARLVWVFRWLTGRAPRPAELDVLERLYRDEIALFEADAASARAYLAAGGWKEDPGAEVPALAALAAVSSAVLNFDESLTRR